MKRIALFVFICFVYFDAFTQNIQDSSNDIRIAWDYSSMQKIADKGGYPRLLRLKDSSIIVIYETLTGNIEYKRSYDNGITWGNPIQVFSQFSYSNLDGQTTLVNMANPEIKQLQNGDLIIGCNYRPAKAEIAPYSIVIRRSKDNGDTWLPPQVLYNAAPRFGDGCWEPFFLQLPNGELQTYFANENPYQQSDEQEISMLSSYDNGVTWTDKPKTVSFRIDRRDGMPVATIVKDEIVMVIEDNYIKAFKPYTVRTKLSDNWSEPVLGNSVNRDYALSMPIADSVYMGAPYILKLPTSEVLISYQSTENRSPDWGYSTMEVAIGDKSARNFKYRTRPFEVPLTKEAKWNSLALWDENTVVAVTSSDFKTKEVAPWIIKGHIIPSLKIKENQITEYPIFIGAKGETNLRIGIGVDNENIYINAKIKDSDLTASDGVCLYLSAKNNQYKISSNYKGKIDIQRKKGNTWKQMPAKNLLVESNIIIDGYDLNFVIPQKLLSGFDKKTLGLTAALSAYNEDESGYTEFIANTDEQSVQNWLKIEFVK